MKGKQMEHKIKIPQKVSELVTVRDRLLASGVSEVARQAENINALLRDIEAGLIEPSPEE